MEDSMVALACLGFALVSIVVIGIVAEGRKLAIKEAHQKAAEKFLANIKAEADEERKVNEANEEMWEEYLKDCEHQWMTLDDILEKYKGTPPRRPKRKTKKEEEEANRKFIEPFIAPNVLPSTYTDPQPIGTPCIPWSPVSPWTSPWTPNTTDGAGSVWWDTSKPFIGTADDTIHIGPQWTNVTWTGSDASSNVSASTWTITQ